MSRRRRRNRLPQEPVALEIESLNQEGKGVAHHDGKAVFVAGALPGEQVLARYLKKQKRHDEAVAVEVIKASLDRIEPTCDVFTTCGGCTLQHLDSDHQVTAKQAALLETLKRIGKVTPANVLPPLMNDLPWGYRRKARLGVKYVRAKEKVLVGFRERGSSLITDATRCPVLFPSVGEHLQDLAALIDALSIRDRLPQIEVAVDDTHTVLVLRILEPLSDNDRERLLNYASQHQVVFYLQPGGPDTVQPLQGEEVDLQYRLPDFDVSYHFLPTDFTQVNTDINRKMVNLALKLLDLQPDDRVLDLFCGLGNFTLAMARQAAEVVGVEGDAALVERARQNALGNGLHNTRYFLANLYESIDAEAWQGEKFDKILLDPPRSGAYEIVQLIEQFDADRIVYVSCYPGTLARDLDVLVNEKGYRLEAAGVMDMFPHTGHVESIALLTR